MTLSHLYINAFSIFGLPIRWYGLAFVAAYTGGYIWMLRSKQLKDGEAEDLLFWLGLGMVLGARAGFLLAAALDGLGQQYLANPGQMLAIWQGGLSFHGGLFGAAAALVLWVRKINNKYRHSEPLSRVGGATKGEEPRLQSNAPRLSLARLTDQLVLILPFGGTLVRLANFFAGDLRGKLSGPGLLAARFPDEEISRLPYQLIDALSYLVLGLFLIWFYRRVYSGNSRLAKTNPRWGGGTISLAFLVGVLILRFLTDFAREPTLLVLRLTPAQWFSLVALVLIAAISLFRAKKKSTRV